MYVLTRFALFISLGIGPFSLVWLSVTLDDLTTIRESEKKSQLSPVLRQWSSLAIHPWSFLLFTRVCLLLRLQRSLEKIGRDFCIIWWIMRVPGPKSPCPPTLRARGGARSQHDALLPSGSLEYFSFTGGGGGAGCYALQPSAAQAGSSGFSTLLCVIKCERYGPSIVVRSSGLELLLWWVQLECHY